MMIDFALEAEREEGIAPVDAIYQACLLRFRPIMMTTMAALLGGVPLALGTGTGSELRRPLGITIIGGLIFSQLLTLYTTPVIYLLFDRLAARFSRHPDTASRNAACSGSGGGGLHEYLGTVHSQTGRHHAADDRHRAGRRRGVPAAARCRRCRRWISRPSRCRRACRAPVRRPWPRRLRRRSNGSSDASPSVTEMTSSSSLGSTSITLQFDLEPQYRRRRARRAGGHQCRPRLSAHQSSEQSQLPQGEPRRFAHLHDWPHLQRAHQRPDVRCRFHHHGAEALADHRRRTGDRGRKRAARRARRAESDAAEQVRHRTGAGAQRARGRQRQYSERPFLGRPADVGSGRQRSDFQSHRLRAAGDRLSQRAARCAFRTSGAPSIRWRIFAMPATPTASPPCC